MSYPKFVNLVKTIAAKTSSGQLKWEQTEREGVFQVALSKGAIRIRQAPTGSNQIDICIAIFNEHGQLVEEVSDPEMEPAMSAGTAYKTFLGIYEGARRAAMGLDQTLDALLEELDGDVPF